MSASIKMLGKTSMANEPARLRRGKNFHLRQQAEWEEVEEGEVSREKRMRDPDGHGGRIDILVDEGAAWVSVVEFKSSDWDSMSNEAVGRNVRRQIRQVWRYIESQLNEGWEVCPGVVFEMSPADPERKRTIEEMFDEAGISVVWEGDNLDDRRARS